MRSGNDIHIHRIAFDKSFYGSLNPSQAHNKYQEGLDEVHTYLQEMDIPESIYEKMISMPSYTAVLLENAPTLWITPSFGEWLTARCGPPNTRPDSQCELNEWRKISEESMRKFRSSE